MCYLLGLLKNQIETERLPPLVANGIPLCSAQYERLFGTTRLPGKEAGVCIHVCVRVCLFTPSFPQYRQADAHPERGLQLPRGLPPRSLVQSASLPQEEATQSGGARTVSRNQSLAHHMHVLDFYILKHITHIHSIFQQLLDDADTDVKPGEEHLAALTTTDRKTWAETREEFFVKGINGASMETIEKVCRSCI